MCSEMVTRDRSHPRFSSPRFSSSVLVTLILLASLILVFWLYTRAEKAIDRAHEQRQVSLALADELSRSSDDLTRMASVYVMTGNPVFRTYYQDILDIRDGKQPRPEPYQNLYWNLVIAGQQSHPPERGPRMALLDLIRQTGIGEVEFRKLEEAKSKSDRLASRELAAFRLMETQGPNREQDQAKANQMLLDDQYHQAKADIMRSIQEFSSLMDQRTRQTVETAEARATALRGIFIAFGLSLLYMLWRTYRSLREAAVQLRQSEERLRLAIEGAGLGTWSWDLATDTLVASERYLAQFAIPPGEVSTYENFLSHIHPDDRQAVDRQVRRALDDHTDYRPEYRVLWPDGSIHWISALGRVYLAPDGVPERLGGITIDITGRKQTEQELRDSERSLRELTANLERDVEARTAEVRATTRALQVSEERHRLLAENALDVVWTMELDGTISYVSPAVEQVRGFSPEEAMRQSLEEILTPDSQALVVGYFHRLQTAVQGGLTPEKFRGELEYRCRDGTTIWTEVIALPVLGPEGAPVQILGVTRDISARKAVEAQLKANELRLRRMLEHLPTAISVASLGPDHRVLFNNAQFVRTFGYSPEDIPTVADWARLAYPDESYRRATFEGWDAAVVRATHGDGQVAPRELRVTCKDGSQRDVVISAAVLDDMLIASFLDITERKAVESALRASEERFRLVATNASDNVWTMGLDYRFRFLSPSITNLTGYTVDEFMQLPLERQLAPGSLPVALEYFAAVDACIAAGCPVAPFRGEIELRCRDGSGIWTEIIVNPLLDANGRVVELAGVTRDIREHKRFEQELQQARDAAEAANAAKSEFLAHMSHEIRTPLNAVLGLAQVLNRESLASNQRDMVERIQSAGQSLLGIINDVLDLSKIEAGQLRIEARAFDLGRVLTKLDSLLGHSARAKGIALRLLPPEPPLGWLLGDDLRLEQVLVNLIGNAIKFTMEGEVTLRVQALAIGESSVRLRFAVHDTGIGIPAEALGRLFAPFTQAESGITRRFGGTGLGLCISKRLVQLMEGEIGVESEVGRGSIFWFELPLARAAEGEPAEQPAPSLRTGSPVPLGPRLAGAHFLVVDDSAMNRDLVERALGLEGARVTLAGDGHQALEILKTRPTAFDAVLMDVRMPVMDGLTATRLIRQELGLTGLPVVALTAGVLPEEQAAARAAGMDAVLAKPLDLEQMLTLLAQWVGSRPDATSPIPPTLPGSAPEHAGDWPDIVGIDRDRAAHSMGHDRSFFLRLLGRLIEDCAGMVDQTRRDLVQGDRQTAARRMHTLRGNAGTIGAVGIMAVATELERAIERGETDLEVRLSDLDRQLVALTESAASWCQAPTVAAQAPAVEPLDAGSLDELRAALSRNNFRAKRLFEALQPALKATLGEKRVAVIDRAIRNLRFDEALSLLDQMALDGVENDPAGGIRHEIALRLIEG